MLPKNEEGFEKYKKWAKFWLKQSNVIWTNVWIGGQSVLGDKYGAIHWYPEPSGIYDMEDPETGEILTNEINKAYINPEDHTYQKLVQICMMLDTYYWGENMIIRFQKCKRKFIGRVLCEFPSLPRIHIKGLCKENTMDRDYQLMAPEPTQGKKNTNETRK